MTDRNLVKYELHKYTTSQDTLNLDKSNINSEPSKLKNNYSIFSNKIWLSFNNKSIIEQYQITINKHISSYWNTLYSFTLLIINLVLISNVKNNVKDENAIFFGILLSKEDYRQVKIFLYLIIGINIFLCCINFASILIAIFNRLIKKMIITNLICMLSIVTLELSVMSFKYIEKFVLNNKFIDKQKLNEMEFVSYIRLYSFVFQLLFIFIFRINYYKVILYYLLIIVIDLIVNFSVFKSIFTKEIFLRFGAYILNTIFLYILEYFRKSYFYLKHIYQKEFIRTRCTLNKMTNGFIIFNDKDLEFCNLAVVNRFDFLLEEKNKDKELLNSENIRINYSDNEINDFSEEEDKKDFKIKRRKTKDTRISSTEAMYESGKRANKILSVGIQNYFINNSIFLNVDNKNIKYKTKEENLIVNNLLLTSNFSESLKFLKQNCFLFSDFVCLGEKKFTLPNTKT